MTTELVILLSFVVLIMMAVLQNLPTSFQNSAPYLSARMEKHIETGVGFTREGQVSWEGPR